MEKFLVSRLFVLLYILSWGAVIGGMIMIYVTWTFLFGGSNLVFFGAVSLAVGSSLVLVLDFARLVVKKKGLRYLLPMILASGMLALSLFLFEGWEILPFPAVGFLLLIPIWLFAALLFRVGYVRNRRHHHQ